MIASDRSLLICHLRPARLKARVAALAEVLALLRDLDPAVAPGGPLAEQRGTFWIDCPSSCIARVTGRLPRLGYTSAVDLVEPVTGTECLEQEGAARECIVRWRRQPYRLTRLYAEDAASLRERAPDRRLFLFATRQGEVRAVRGYRGDGRPLSRRGLPVYDARLLVNLVYHPRLGQLLDPFAGTGGVLLEALASGWSVVSGDIDPALRYGLTALPAAHWVGDARALPLATAAVAAIASELPFERESAGVVLPAFREMSRVLVPGGRLALVVAPWQASLLRDAAIPLGLRSYLDTPVNRKGIDTVVFVWEKR